jgi:hypothetical protein
MTYDFARNWVAEWLERHAATAECLELHRATAASAHQPHQGYDEVDHGLPRGDDPRWHKIFVALSFWDGWIDASNHDWTNYDSIWRADWPTLAREIAADLRADREVSNPIILAQFEFRRK